MLTSCKNDASSNSNNSLFGEIPSIYEKKQVEIIEKMKSIVKGKEKEAAPIIVAEIKMPSIKQGKRHNLSPMKWWERFYPIHNRMNFLTK